MEASPCEVTCMAACCGLLCAIQHHIRDPPRPQVRTRANESGLTQAAQVNTELWANELQVPLGA